MTTDLKLVRSVHRWEALAADALLKLRTLVTAQTTGYQG